jgi:hypothetical protein
MCGEREVALRGGRNVNDIGSGVAYEIRHVTEEARHAKSLCQLTRHKLLAVTDTYDLAATDSTNLRGV